MALWGTTEWLSGPQQSDSLGHNRVALWGTTASSDFDFVHKLVYANVMQDSL